GIRILSSLSAEEVCWIGLSRLRVPAGLPCLVAPAVWRGVPIQSPGHCVDSPAGMRSPQGLSLAPPCACARCGAGHCTGLCGPTESVVLSLLKRQRLGPAYRRARTANKPYASRLSI